MCTTAVIKNEDELKYCHCIDKEMLNNIFKSKKGSVRKNRFEFINLFNEDVIIRIIKVCGYILSSLDKNKITYNVAKEAVMSNGYNIKYVPIELRTEEIINLALNNNPDASKYLK